MAMDFPFRTVDESSHFPSWHFVADHRFTAVGSGRGSPFHSLGLMVDTLIGITFFAWAPFLSVIVGVLYFVCSTSTAPLGRRVVSSAYAPSAAVIYLAVAFSPALGNAHIARLYPAIVAIPLLLLVFSLLRFPGPRWVHVVLMPIAALCLLWQGAWSYWGVYGK
jgi:hypothetical protein